MIMADKIMEGKVGGRNYELSCVVSRGGFTRYVLVSLSLSLCSDKTWRLQFPNFNGYRVCARARGHSFSRVCSQRPTFTSREGKALAAGKSELLPRENTEILR